MKLNFSTPILGLDGQPIKNAKGEDATIGSVAIEALMAVFPDEQNLLGADKLHRWRLAKLASKGGEQEVIQEDMTLLKTLVGKAYGPAVVGPVYEIIEG